MESLFNSVKVSIENAKKSLEDISNKKEEMKIGIQKIFTKLRNELNNREDELLLKVDKKFENFLSKENTLKKFEKLSEKIKISFNESKY